MRGTTGHGRRVYGPVGLHHFGNVEKVDSARHILTAIEPGSPRLLRSIELDNHILRAQQLIGLWFLLLRSHHVADGLHFGLYVLQVERWDPIGRIVLCWRLLVHFNELSW